MNINCKREINITYMNLYLQRVDIFYQFSRKHYFLIKCCECVHLKWNDFNADIQNNDSNEIVKLTARFRACWRLYFEIIYFYPSLSFSIIHYIILKPISLIKFSTGQPQSYLFCFYHINFEIIQCRIHIFHSCCHLICDVLICDEQA